MILLLFFSFFFPSSGSPISVNCGVLLFRTMGLPPMTSSGWVLGDPRGQKEKERQKNRRTGSFPPAFDSKVQLRPTVSLVEHAIHGEQTRGNRRYIFEPAGNYWIRYTEYRSGDFFLIANYVVWKYTLYSTSKGGKIHAGGGRKTSTIYQLHPSRKINSLVWATANPNTIQRICQIRCDD